MHPVSARHGKGRLAAAAAGMGIILALTSCTGTPNTQPSSSASAPPATSETQTSGSTTPGTAASPTATAPVYRPADATGPAQNVPLPVKPPLANEFSKAGIEAFARYWYETLSYAYETGESKPMDAVTDSGCTTCANAREVADGWHGGGRWLVGGKMAVLDTKSTFVLTPAGTYQATSFVRQTALDYYNGDGTLNESTKAAPAVADILVARRLKDSWVALTVEHLGGQQ